MSALFLTFYQHDGTCDRQSVGSLDEAVAKAFMAFDTRGSVTGLPIEVCGSAGNLVMDHDELVAAAHTYAHTVAYPDFQTMN